jgi:hypothetical protein
MYKCKASWVDRRQPVDPLTLRIVHKIHELLSDSMVFKLSGKFNNFFFTLFYIICSLKMTFMVEVTSLRV